MTSMPSEYRKYIVLIMKAFKEKEDTGVLSIDTLKKLDEYLDEKDVKAQLDKIDISIEVK